MGEPPEKRMAGSLNTAKLFRKTDKVKQFPYTGDATYQTRAPRGRGKCQTRCKGSRELGIRNLGDQAKQQNTTEEVQKKKEQEGDPRGAQKENRNASSNTII